MKAFKYLCCSLLLIGLWMSLPVTAASPKPKQALLITVNGAIGPATADFIDRGVRHAQHKGMPFVLLKLDTPGGLAKSMRLINKTILNSPIPIITFVSPRGARAASAGTFILYASHVAAMAPGTNLGAASPVNIGGGGLPKAPGSSEKPEDKNKKAKPKKSAMEQKVSNDAIATIRSLAQLRGRNVKFAEDAVKKASTLTAQEAKQKGVIDLIAEDVPDLLHKLNGRNIKLHGQVIVLDTTDIFMTAWLPDWRMKFLTVITDPSVAYVLLLLGIYGLFFEFANPGFVVPGVVGAIAMLLALYALQLLPISYAGLGLILLGIIFMIVEAFVPSFGALGIGGVIAFVVGSILLFDTQVAGFSIAWPLIFSMAILNLLFFIVVLSMAIKARQRQVVSGREEMLNATGEALENIQRVGHAHIRGERWQVEVTEPVYRGQAVAVIGMNGLVLKVRPIKGETK